MLSGSSKTKSSRFAATFVSRVDVRLPVHIRLDAASRIKNLQMIRNNKLKHDAQVRVNQRNARA